jgi:hypothetical protein
MFQLECSSSTSYVVASWVAFRLNHGGRQCWGYLKIQIGSPNTREYAIVTVKSTGDARGDKGSPKDCSCLKSCEPFYTCPRAPFIGRRMDFYIPKVPSNLRNIPDVNTYINVFYISYIYKPTTSSHIKPGLLRQRLWLGFLLIHESFIHRNPHAP